LTILAIPEKVNEKEEKNHRRSGIPGPRPRGGTHKQAKRDSTGQSKEQTPPREGLGRKKVLGEAEGGKAPVNQQPA